MEAKTSKSVPALRNCWVLLERVDCGNQDQDRQGAAATAQVDIDRPFKCSRRDKIFRARSNRSHKRIGFSCKFCTILCQSKFKLTQHEMIHSGDRPYGCTYCSKQLRDKYALVRHYRTHTGEKPYKCDECSKAFSSSSGLTTHKGVHSDAHPYSCAFCMKTFRSFTGKRMHEERSCPNSLVRIEPELKHECKTCGKKYRQPSKLQEHVRSHTGETPFNCGFCSKSFTTSASCRKHQQTHTGEKPYKCHFCERTFRISAHRTVHERTHNGEKPYGCKICNKAFNSSGNRDKHEKIHSGKKSIVNFVQRHSSRRATATYMSGGTQATCGTSA